MRKIKEFFRMLEIWNYEFHGRMRLPNEKAHRIKNLHLYYRNKDVEDRKRLIAQLKLVEEFKQNIP